MLEWEDKQQHCTACLRFLNIQRMNGVSIYNYRERSLNNLQLRWLNLISRSAKFPLIQVQSAPVAGVCQKDVQSLESIEDYVYEPGGFHTSERRNEAEHPRQSHQ